VHQGARTVDGQRALPQWLYQRCSFKADLDHDAAL